MVLSLIYLDEMHFQIFCTSFYILVSSHLAFIMLNALKKKKYPLQNP